VIDDDKPSLSVCAFGAGLAHAAALALILPIVITLPAPADPAPQLVAIHVEIQSVAAEPIAQGDAEDIEPPRDTLDSADATTALPAPAATGKPNDGTAADASEPEAPEDALAPGPKPDESEQLGAVANVDAVQTPALVPVPPRRPALGEAVENSEPPAKATIKDVPKKLGSASRPRTRTAAKPVDKKLLLGGRTATPMPEYPSPAQPFGGPD
jgi:hypothetical protein